MPQLATRLLLAAVLIAVGVASIVYTGSHVGPGMPQSAIISIYFSAFALIGAGLSLPFKRPLFGAFLGLIAAIAVLIFIQSSREKQAAPNKSSDDHPAAAAQAP